MAPQAALEYRTGSVLIKQSCFKSRDVDQATRYDGQSCCDGTGIRFAYKLK